MQLYKCDICGKQFDLLEYYDLERHYELRQLGDVDKKKHKRIKYNFDICLSCEHALQKQIVKRHCETNGIDMEEIK